MVESIVMLMTANDVKKIAEIGVYGCNLAGQLMRKLADELDEYYLIDWWHPCEGIGSANFIAIEKWEELHQRACKMEVDYKPIKVMRLESTEAARLFPNGYLDMVFIDAAHLYDSVVADINAWKPKVKKNGILSGHDYSSGWPEVVKAVDDIFGKPSRLSGGVWWTRI